MTADADRGLSGPVVFAYDGSDLARLAIGETGQLLGGGREALVLTVWQLFDLGFIAPGDREFDAADAPAVQKAAEQTAAAGASLAESAGFRAQSLAVQVAPTWKGIVQVGDDYHAALIALGSHGRRSLAETLLGSVAGAVAEHCQRAVLIVHRRG